MPPYTPISSYEDGKLDIKLNFNNYKFVFAGDDLGLDDFDLETEENAQTADGAQASEKEEPGFFASLAKKLESNLYLLGYWQSLKVAFISTLCCLVIGYPLAWAIVHASPTMRSILLMLVILPSWTSFLIRVYAWMGLLSDTGFINQVLLFFHIIDEPLVMLHTQFAVYVGIVYAYLPFMIMPLYNAISRVDYSYIEASMDLGARPMTTFFRVLLPLTKNGVIAGSMLVFIPAIGEFVIPELLGGPDAVLIGQLLWQDFFNNRDWPLASTIAVIMLCLVIVPIMWFFKVQRASEVK
ncbi:MAG: ABC transporter permease subunit [Succinivibrionaceae bacterium]|nr:ABC transporter permease subunit [Succinivibrionaceae bacterium]